MRVTDEVKVTVNRTNSWASQTVVEVESFARQVRAKYERYKEIDARDVRTVISMQYGTLRATFEGEIT